VYNFHCVLWCNFHICCMYWIDGLLFHNLYTLSTGHCWHWATSWPFASLVTGAVGLGTSEGCEVCPALLWVLERSAPNLLRLNGEFC
jgi:hypothetical protein